MIRTLTINLNDTVHVKITDDGREFLKTLPERRVWPIDGETDGAVMQLHDLAYTFGPALFLGCRPPIEMNVALELKDARICTICDEPILTGTFVGDGDGSGNRFAHRHCYDMREVLEDKRRLTRELDMLLNGDSAAPQASLCDIVSQLSTTPVAWMDNETIQRAKRYELLATHPYFPEEEGLQTGAELDAVLDYCLDAGLALEEFDDRDFRRYLIEKTQL